MHLMLMLTALSEVLWQWFGDMKDIWPEKNICANYSQSTASGTMPPGMQASMFGACPKPG